MSKRVDFEIWWMDPPTASAGRDHLGLQAASVALYSELVPLITNTTLRARYYSFYPWLLDEYAKRHGQADEKVWRRFLRRGEALLALCRAATHPSEKRSGVAGITWASGVLDGQADDARIDFTSPKHLRAKNGAFGHAYGNVLATLDFVAVGSTHGLPVPTQKGLAVAKAFRASSGRASAFVDGVEQGVLTVSEIRELGRMVGIDGLPCQSDERQMIEDALVLGDGAQRNAQRCSILLILLVCRAHHRALDARHLVWALYSGFDEEGKPLRIPAKLEGRLRQWRGYHANELTHVVFESVLEIMLASLAPEGNSVGEVLAKLSGFTLTGLGIEGTCTWQDFCDEIQLDPNARADGPGAEWKYTACLWDSHEKELRCAAALRLLSLLAKRWGTCSPELGPFAPSGVLGGRFKHRTVRGVLQYLAEHAQLQLRELLPRLFKRFVIDQHLRVAFAKLRFQKKSTFLFHLEGDRLLRVKGVAPVYTNPRLETTMMFLRDLYLLDDDGPTALGERLLDCYLSAEVA